MTRDVSCLVVLLAGVCVASAGGAYYCSGDCAVSEWSDWSSCVYNRRFPSFVSCQVRSREVTIQPLGNGAACPVLHDVRACQPSPPTGCRWSEWSQCSYNSYNERTRTRTRQCHPFTETEDCDEPVRTRPIPPQTTLPPIQTPTTTSGGKKKCRRGRQRTRSGSDTSGDSDSSCDSDSDSDSDDDKKKSKSRSRSRSRSGSRNRSQSGNRTRSRSGSRSRSQSGTRTGSRSGSRNGGTIYNYRTTTRAW
uniref:Spondin-like TSP1 domain-containing protein n=1 Tax=Ciona savignyi TaxID=51511 RepID=H2Z272_CIOSA